MAHAKSWKWSEARKRFLYDHKDLRLNIPRHRRAFKTEEEAEHYHKELLRKYLGIGTEKSRCRLFGEALAEYLETISRKQRSHADNLSNAAALRWPYLYKGTFYRLEELPLDDSEHGILIGLNRWLADQETVEKRCYINGEIYQLRNDQWFHQPITSLPAARTLITNKTLLTQLNASTGRGSFSTDTLRIRQQLVASVLKAAYKNFRWTEKNLGDFIDRIDGHDGHQRKLSTEQLSELVDQARTRYGELFALLIMGGARIGWRRSNLIGLTWNRVMWPEGNLPGFLFIPKTKGASFNPFDKAQRRERTKNGHELVTVMDDRIEQLLRRLYDLRDPDSAVVFHNGEGHYWGECRKRWNNTKKLANIDPAFRWHDLRHTWASELINAGVDQQAIMEQQGWKSTAMVARYGHKDLTTRAKAISRRTQ